MNIPFLKSGSFERTRKKDNFLVYSFKQRDLILLALPVLIYTFIFKYVPMAGLIIAFKNLRYDLGFLKSPWIGLKNFEFLFKSSSFAQFTTNTILYNLAFIILLTILSVIFALLINEISNTKALKIYQTAMFLPYFISFVVVGYIGLTFLNPTLGVVNRALSAYGFNPPDWYSKPTAWIFILPLVYIWKNLGYSVIIYYAALMGVNREFYEAAEIDGASKIKQAWHISIPFLKPVMIILILIAIGNIFRADFGLFYMVPQQENSPNIYSTTDVIDTYIYRALKVNGDLGMSSAAGFYQSILGFITLVVCNKVVKRFNDGAGLF